MRHRKSDKKLGRKSPHRKAMFNNLVTSLLTYGRIETTEAKAKAVRGLADHVVTLAKRENLHARRQVLAMVPDTEVVRKLFDVIAARFADRHGGYTRIMHAGTRPGDRAPMVILELVDRPEAPREKSKKDAKGDKREDKGEASAGAGRSRRRKAVAAAG